jgi:hypothetical protein
VRAKPGHPQFCAGQAGPVHRQFGAGQAGLARIWAISLKKKLLRLNANRMQVHAFFSIKNKIQSIL